MKSLKEYLRIVSRRDFLKWSAFALAATMVPAVPKAEAAKTGGHVVEELPGEIFIHAPGWYIPH
ncbi:MAG TPA: twin-arginine translocation signal domain-containing protein [bacterium]|nr:twin-arginine translocation signal domain-containing protein [bacterium]